MESVLLASTLGLGLAFVASGVSIGYASLIGPGLGSTTDRPVEVAPCSVLVVK
jgi:hypothetical protein